MTPGLLAPPFAVIHSSFKIHIERLSFPQATADTPSLPRVAIQGLTLFLSCLADFVHTAFSAPVPHGQGAPAVILTTPINPTGSVPPPGSLSGFGLWVFVFITPYFLSQMAHHCPSPLEGGAVFRFIITTP